MPIKKLSVQLANQIAAGEVVENPASVVKELLENAIDAKASAITLEIKDAGKLLIKVTDNGQGIPHEELPLALAPHATSKIHELEDLDGIVTLGFRGEALASIAAVSKLSLISNTKEQEHGYKVEVEGPEQHPYIYPAAHPVGTSVIVRELFFNTPARRRFLKSDKTELAKIKDIFTRIALVNYSCEFNFIVDGRMMLQLPATDRSGLSQRITKLLGSEYKGPLIHIDSADPEFQRTMAQIYREENFASQGHTSLQLPPVLTMHGVLIYPEMARRGIADKLVFFLNGRCMGDKLVARAIKEGVSQALEAAGDFKPAVRGVLFLECDPHIVDVNVHPRKDEVRFHQGHVIFDCITTTIKAALYRHGLNAYTFGRGTLGLEDPSTAGSSAAAATTAATEASASPAPATEAKATDIPPAPASPLPLSQGREAELRERVEQYLAQNPAKIYADPKATAEAERTLRGCCCDFGSLSEARELETLRAASQAISGFRTNAAPEATSEEAEPASTTESESDEPELRSSLESLFLRQERYRRSGVDETQEVTTEASTTITPQESWKRADLAPETMTETEARLGQAQSFGKTIDLLPESSTTTSINTCTDTSTPAAESSILERLGPRPTASRASASAASQAISDYMKSVGEGEESNKAQFLAIVAPNVLLFSLRQHYFLGKGSELLIECLAKEYAKQVNEDRVNCSLLRVPFAIKVESTLIKAYKNEDIKKAAKRCGFTLVVRTARSLLELHSVPEYLIGCNLAPIANTALHLIAAAADSINGTGLNSPDQQGQGPDQEHPVSASRAPEQLCTLLARAREYEINTEFDARALLSSISELEQLNPLIAKGALQELNLLQLAQQLLGRTTLE